MSGSAEELFIDEFEEVEEQKPDPRRMSTSFGISLSDSKYRGSILISDPKNVPSSSKPIPFTQRVQLEEQESRSLPTSSMSSTFSTHSTPVSPLTPLSPRGESLAFSFESPEKAGEKLNSPTKKRSLLSLFRFSPKKPPTPKTPPKQEFFTDRPYTPLDEEDPKQTEVINKHKNVLAAASSLGLL